MKTAVLTLCLAWAAPSHADTSLPSSGAQKSWADSCAARINATAEKLGLRPSARAVLYPLRREDGSLSPVHYVEYDAFEFVQVTVGDDSNRENSAVTNWQLAKAPSRFWFRRNKTRFGKVYVHEYQEQLKLVVDECLKMGDSK